MPGLTGSANANGPLYGELERLRGVVGEQCQEIGDLKKEINNLILSHARSPYEKPGLVVGGVVTVKQKAYGRSFNKAGDVLRLLYPSGITLEQYDDALAVTRTIDKLLRIATDRYALGESLYKDIVGYGLLSERDLRNKNKEQEHEDEKRNSVE